MFVLYPTDPFTNFTLNNTPVDVPDRKEHLFPDRPFHSFPSDDVKLTDFLILRLKNFENVCRDFNFIGRSVLKYLIFTRPTFLKIIISKMDGREYILGKIFTLFKQNFVGSWWRRRLNGLTSGRFIGCCRCSSRRLVRTSMKFLTSKSSITGTRTWGRWRD